ncbi:hypothetical protein [Paenisporosarcina sp. TG-14]|uniref:hypothetical protein n=1 Tax=Paenisporosarcina sp. TG-14 TaxID=1231057 RepID=UPI00031E2583|nr:hypothetical protein [Paenisporosarcina sp. TG-14]
MRPSSHEIMDKLDTDYIDAELKDLSFDHANHLVQMRYGDPGGKDSDSTISFVDCLSVTFNK